jgi:hypothetical protein
MDNTREIVYESECGIIYKDELTCLYCINRETCYFVDDPYNTGGDCLASK